MSLVVTLEPKHEKTIPPVEAKDFIVREANETRPATGLTSLANADTQFLLLIDDSASGSFGTEIPTLKQFLRSLPANYEIAVGYMRNGMALMTQNFTKDHAAAANAIRLAIGPGGSDVSPFDSLTDATKKWLQPAAQRKEALMISSGIEALGGGYPPENPYVNAGIASAQKAGIVVYTIFSPGSGHWGHSYWHTMWGQNFLAQLSDETGGESYYLGPGAPVSFEPYLQQILKAQPHQYLLSFDARPENKSGLQPIKVSIEGKDVSVAAPNKIFVKASL